VERLRAPELIQKLVAAPEWSLVTNITEQELQLTVSTPAGDLEAFLGPRPAELGYDEYVLFLGRLEDLTLSPDVSARRNELMPYAWQRRQ
jgi:hypothetical protein